MQKITDIMPIDTIDDWDKRIARHDACFKGEIIDRPVVCISIPKENRTPFPEKHYDDIRDWWFDFDHRSAETAHNISNTIYMGDALPKAFANLGPEIFSAYFGCELGYVTKTTSWSEPNLLDWNDVDKINYTRENPYWLAIKKYTDTLLELGQNKFYVGYTDIHTGADALCAFRDPANFCMDLLDSPDQVKKLLRKVDDAFCDEFNYTLDYLESLKQPCTTWAGMVSTMRYHVPSNDFSCMISNEMFREFFLDGIIRECRTAEANIYHLDGPGALQHLDTLLEIPELNILQWVYGSGNGIASDWLDIHKKAQAAGKGVQIFIDKSELENIIGNLKPEGVFLSVGGVTSVEEGQSIINRVSKWT